MKNIFLIILALFTILSCKKDKKNSPSDPTTDVSQVSKNKYPRPWKTTDISWQNSSNPCGSHSNGYKLYYKDTLIGTDCHQYGWMTLVNPLVLNDSIMLLYKLSGLSGIVMLTKMAGIHGPIYRQAQTVLLNIIL